LIGGAPSNLVTQPEMFHVEHRVFCLGEVAASDVPRGTSLVFDRGRPPQVGGTPSQRCSTWNIVLFCRGEGSCGRCSMWNIARFCSRRLRGSDVPRGTSLVFERPRAA
jgi:hypothetical protein